MRVSGTNLPHIGLGLFIILALTTTAQAEDLRVFVPRAIATVLSAVGAQFEQESGYKLAITSDVGAGLIRRINAGEPFDVFAGTPSQVAGLIKDGKVIADTRADLVRSGIGVEVRAGAPKPDISSVEAFKRTLLDAKSIAYLKEGASGLYLAGLLDRLGIADTIKSKVTRPDADIVSEFVAKGEVEIGMVVMTQILTTPGVELVGPLPVEIQSYVSFVGAVGSNSHAPDVARELIKFLTGPVGGSGHQIARHGAGLRRYPAPARALQGLVGVRKGTPLKVQVWHVAPILLIAPTSESGAIDCGCND